MNAPQQHRQPHEFCCAHLSQQRVDQHWFAMWVDSDGDLRTSPPGAGLQIDFHRGDTWFVCGQGCALTLTERWLHSGNFDPPQGGNRGRQIVAGSGSAHL